MYVLLDEREKELFDMLIDGLHIRDALNLLSEYVFLKGGEIIVKQGRVVKVEEEDDDDGDDGDDGDEVEEKARIPVKKGKVKPEPETTLIKPIPKYDKEIITENRMYV